jgi:hypothetical protein
LRPFCVRNLTVYLKNKHWQNNFVLSLTFILVSLNCSNVKV